MIIGIDVGEVFGIGLGADEDLRIRASIYLYGS